MLLNIPCAMFVVFVIRHAQAVVIQRFKKGDTGICTLHSPIQGEEQVYRGLIVQASQFVWTYTSAWSIECRCSIFTDRR